METCKICGKTTEQLAKESPNIRTITLESKHFAPYNLCEDCDETLDWAICKKLEYFGLVIFNQDAGEFLPIKKTK